MKSEITFSFNEDEQEELHRMLSYADLYAFMWEFENWMRSRFKHGELDDISECELEHIRDRYFEMKGDYNIHEEG